MPVWVSWGVPACVREPGKVMFSRIGRGEGCGSYAVCGPRSRHEFRAHRLGVLWGAIAVGAHGTVARGLGPVQAELRGAIPSGIHHPGKPINILVATAEDDGHICELMLLRVRLKGLPQRHGNLQGKPPLACVS